jgi:hypothetical protein
LIQVQCSGGAALTATDRSRITNSHNFLHPASRCY